MGKVRAIAISLVLVALLNTGCVRPVSHLDRVKVGMTKAQVVEQVGKAYRPAGVVQTKHGQTVEVLEYKFKVKYNEEYWLYFVEDSLVRFGQASDWGSVSGVLYDTKFD